MNSPFLTEKICGQAAFTDMEAIHLVPAMQNTLCDYVQYCKDRLFTHF